MSQLSVSVSGASVYDLLADIALRAPGTAAPRGALTVLGMLAQRGDIAAALAIGRVTGSELGLDVSGLVPQRCPSFGALAGLAGTGDASTLPCVLAAGFLPWQFIEDQNQWLGLIHTVFSEDAWPAFQALVARGGVARDFALRGYAMAAVAMAAVAGRDLLGMGTRFIMRLVGVAMGARVVDGNDADSSFRFGADLLLTTGPKGLSIRMAHELGHHQQRELVGGAPGGQPRDAAADCGLFTAELPGILNAAFARPSRAPAFQTVPGSAGMRLGCSRDQYDGGGLVHVSVSVKGGPPERDRLPALAATSPVPPQCRLRRHGREAPSPSARALQQPPRNVSVTIPRPAHATTYTSWLAISPRTP